MGAAKSSRFFPGGVVRLHDGALTRGIRERSAGAASDADFGRDVPETRPFG
jgi:hypothetical protein